MKNYYITTLLILSSVLLFTSCYYDDSPDEPKIVTTKVHGHLMVLGTEEIINDRPYKIKFINPRTREVLEYDYTDKNGYYEFEFASESVEHPSFYLEFDRSDFPDETYTRGIALKIDTILQPPPYKDAFPGSYKGDGGFIAGYQGWANLCLEKKAWLKLEVENVDGDFGDQIRIRYTSYRGDLVTWEYVFHHQQHFTVILPGVGNVDNYVDYWVTKNDSSIPLQRATVKLGEMDT
ncbi:MAG: hypothetical protein JJU02_10900, partial [Cryomorphaceae bacterium]|nr:hypothetical protein [Cryomorphaceae bacterium]